MGSAIKTLVQDFGWIHTGIGVFGNTTFFAGSILLLPGLATWQAVGMEWQTVGTWLFIAGAFFMLVGAVGNLPVSIYEAREKGEQRS